MAGDSPPPQSLECFSGVSVYHHAALLLQKDAAHRKSDTVMANGSDVEPGLLAEPSS